MQPHQLKPALAKMEKRAGMARRLGIVAEVEPADRLAAGVLHPVTRAAIIPYPIARRPALVITNRMNANVLPAAFMVRGLAST
jgi:hypothetical protein